MSRRLLAVAALASSGCAIGAGASNVGQYRARRVIDSTVCIQAAGDGCSRSVEVGRDVPARSFGGGIAGLWSTGYLQRRKGSAVGHGIVTENYYEYFRGRGGFALGGRIGIDVARGFESRWLVLAPLTLLAHAGWQWGSLYAGAGYSPLAMEKTTAEPQRSTYHADSAHALLGTRLVLREASYRFVTVNPELRYHVFGGSALIGFTANFGYHL